MTASHAHQDSTVVELEMTSQLALAQMELSVTLELQATLTLVEIRMTLMESLESAQRIITVQKRLLTHTNVLMGTTLTM
jgi:hypothetical protein